MKSFIRFSLLTIALICFSNMSIAQKKSKKKAKTSISSKKKQTGKKLNSKKKQSAKKKPSKKKSTTRRSNTIALYSVPTNANQMVVNNTAPINQYQVDQTPEKVVTIVSAFKPQLKNVAKIGFLNATAIVDTNTVALSYQVPSQNLSFQYQPIALVPRAIKIDSIRKLKQSANVKIGLGNYMNQFIQVEASLEDRKMQQHDIKIHNESIAGDHPIQKWKHTGMQYLGALSLNKKLQINTQVYFDQSSRYRYGLVPDTTNLPLSNFEQKLTTIGANFSLVNKETLSSPFYYAPIVQLNHSDLFNQAKNSSIDLQSPILYRINTNINLHADINLNYNQYQTVNNASKQNSIIQINPSFELNKAKFSFKIGVSPTIANGDFAWYPTIDISKQLKDTNMVLNAGWNTSVSNNQIIQLMGQNHWIAAPTDLPISTIEKKYFKVNVTVNKRLNYGLIMALNDYRELPFFNQSKLPNNPILQGLKYDVLFEKRAIAIELMGDLRYQMSDKLLWKNHFKYIQFNLIRENNQAWGILPFEFNTQLNWLWTKKLQLDASGQFWTGSKTSAGLGNAYQLNNTFVLNAGIQYAVSDHWTFWGKGENLLDQQYQRWANYPSLGVQFLAGIQYKFKK